MAFPLFKRDLAIRLAIAVAALALDILAPFNFFVQRLLFTFNRSLLSLLQACERLSPPPHGLSHASPTVTVVCRWARLAAASQELLEEGERLQAEERLCDEAGSSGSESVGDDADHGCAAGGPLQVRSFALISYRRFISHIMRYHLAHFPSTQPTRVLPLFSP
jgi:hypothetical protein